MSDFSFQGRVFKQQAFPSPTSSSSDFSFAADCRCLIDFGPTTNVFLVVSVGQGLKPYQRSLFRLECNRHEIVVDDHVVALSKQQCRQMLRDMLEQLSECTIVGTHFPFIHKTEVLGGKTKPRPCVALHAPNSHHPGLLVAIYLTTQVRDVGNDLSPLIQVTAGSDLLPESAENYIIDCSKMYSLPEKYDLEIYPEDGTKTWWKWPVERFSKSPGNILRLTDPGYLRGTIISKLEHLIENDPHLGYTDETIQYDIGTIVQHYSMEDGELCRIRTVYEGPPGYQPAPAAAPFVVIPEALHALDPENLQTPNALSGDSANVPPDPLMKKD
jgi:hypothetical protein